MCIIVAKPQGIQLPKEEIFENCWDNNPDGAGIMYTKNQLVTIEKGLMTFKAFQGTLKKIQKTIDTTNTAMVFHFRITTHGPTIAANTHPFPISDDADLLQKLRLKTRIGVAHNGIISLVNSSWDRHLSDTQIFIRDYLSIIAEDPKFFNRESTLKLIERLIKSKMTFLTNTGKIINIGWFEEVDGCFYSNDSYLDSYTKYSKYGYYSYGDFDNDNYCYSKKLMWLDDELYIIKNDDFFPLSPHQYLMDKAGLLYVYDYESDKAIYYSHATVYDSNLNRVYFDESRSESFIISYDVKKKKKKGKD